MWQCNFHILGVILDSHYLLRIMLANLNKVEMETIIHALISSCLDYCKAFFTGLNQVSVNHV